MVPPMDGVVLVLNQNYEPLNVCNLPRAFRLLFGLKAEVIEYDHQEIRSIRAVYRAPSVIRLQHQIRRPRPRVKLTRREIFVRDRNTCQYCGRTGSDLTLDHVLPRHRGGQHTWDNLVAACRPCNHRKGGRTPEEARLRLLRQPFEPRSDLYSLFSPYLEDTRNEAWRDYLFLGKN
jgi:5-methylcytosine-specific restriction endonuclease McrA